MITVIVPCIAVCVCTIKTEIHFSPSMTILNHSHHCRMNTLIIAILILYLYDGNFIHAKRHDSITPMILYTALLQRYALFSCSFNGLLPFCTGDNQIIMPHMIHRCTIQNILPFHKTYAFQVRLSEIMQYVLMI